ncbi:MAG: ImmA/IrrE family metallo-endopeptidase [Halobacteriovoraceae bacterium]|nr:ImmA/IrrE family metallo-endopeptidase [Halobacteriovoraceae bacterium]
MAANKDAIRFILGLKIKQLRDAKGLSLKGLSTLSGLSQSYINEIEKGKKYPKVEKLISLAKSLEVSFDNLVSAQLDKKLRPILDFLESDFYKNLPLEMFGIDQYDLYELMSDAPDKFSSFILMMLSLARNYDMNPEEIHRAALRSFIEAHNGSFEDVELAVAQARIRYNLPEKGPITIEKIEKILIEEYKYKIVFATPGKHPLLQTLRSIYTFDRGPILFINKELLETQKLFTIIKEFAFCALNLREEVSETRVDGVKNTFRDVLNDFKSNYFAAALLLNEEVFIEIMQKFFDNQTFSTSSIEEILKELNIGPETFFNRLIQVLPKQFGIDRLFYLKFQTSDVFKGIRRFKITNEIHLNGPHGPQGIRLNEHYCRRWITVSLLDSFCEDDALTDYKLGIQKSKMLESGKEFMCFSVARGPKKPHLPNTCITLGIELNERAREIIKFHKDPRIITKDVSKTCERCPLTDCDERVAPPTIYEKITQVECKDNAVKDLIKEIKSLSN